MFLYKFISPLVVLLLAVCVMITTVYFYNQTKTRDIEIQKVGFQFWIFSATV